MVQPNLNFSIGGNEWDKRNVYRLVGIRPGIGVGEGAESRNMCLKWGNDLNIG